MTLVTNDTATKTEAREPQDANFMDIRLEVDSGCTLGEGPLWVPHTGCLWWVDILKAHLHCLDTETGAHIQRELPTALTALGLHADGGFVGTLWDRFVRLDEDMEIVQDWGVQEPDLPENRFNDGKVDAVGRFWAGTMHADLEHKSGSLYRMLDDVITRHDDGYQVTNGPTFSPDGKVLYHTSTMERVIFAFDMDARGDLSNKRIFARVPVEEGKPDGMTVDEQGDIWMGHYGGGRMTRFGPDGQVKDQVIMPVTNITSCTFGGANLDRMYVTTAADGVDEAHGGGLFSFNPGVKGLPPAYYRG